MAFKVKMNLSDVQNLAGFGIIFYVILQTKLCLLLYIVGVVI